MITDRQKELLKIIVEDYIKSVKPVGSKALCERLDVSSATIRSEMNTLEKLGYLEKTHTSSGRVPSELGYRFYVDHIMVPKDLSGDDMLKLQTIFNNNSLMLTDAISKSMEIITELTNYTSVVLGNNSSSNLLNRIEVVPINANNIVALVVTDKGHVQHKNIYLEEEVNQEEVRQIVDLINKMIVGTPINQVSVKLEYEVKPVIAKVIRQHEVLYNAFYNAFSDFNKEPDFKTIGTKKILMQPEFNDADKIRNIISKFEDNEIVGSIKEEDDEVKIYIGSETNFDEDVTIIKTKYKVGNEEGTIALVGPKRMEYDRVITLLDYIKKNIER